MKRYVVLSVMMSRLEDVLNDLEKLAEDTYRIHSIFPQPVKFTSPSVAVVVEFYILEEDEFDEAEILKKLGL